MVALAGSEVAPVWSETGQYAGLVTRAIAFVIDCAIVNLIALIVAAGTALALTVLPGSQELHAFEVIIAGFVFFLWCIAYWATFWATTGQTPGDRVMHLKRQVPTPVSPPARHRRSPAISS